MRFRYQSGQQVYEVALERQGSAWSAVIDGQPFPVEVLDSQPGQLSLRFDDKPLTVYWAADGAVKWLSISGCAYRLEPPAPRSLSSREGIAGETIRAPMPAQVRAVQVSEGEPVERGQTLLLLEAMKMEIQIKSPAAGIVQRLRVSEGQQVEKDQLLVEVGGEE